VEIVGKIKEELTKELVTRADIAEVRLTREIEVMKLFR
jgi:hypothetical protein